MHLSFGRCRHLFERTVPGRECADLHPFEFDTDVLPGFTGFVLADPDEQESQPAQGDVRADPFFTPVVDRPQIEIGFQRSEAVLNVGQLLIA